MAALVLILLVSLANFHAFSCYKQVEINIPDFKNAKVFSTAEISKYDGSDENLPIYMSVRGVVFDVTTGKSFYGKKSSYNALVGKDATKGVAKMSLDPADLVHDISDLDDRQLEELDKIYTGVYVKKYPVVGYMDFLIKQKQDEKKKKVKDDL